MTSSLVSADGTTVGTGVDRAQASFAVGELHFDDAALEQTRRQSDALAAWRSAFASTTLEAAACKARGDFAVVVRDAVGTKLAVDRFAIRTLCYRIDGDTIRVAERADDLADDTTEIDAQAIFDYLYFHAIPSPRTIFKGVHRLPPGHCARFARGELTVEPYWRPVFVDGPARFDELREEFRALLRAAVKRRLGNGTTACFLSGGTDSSTVAGLLGEVTGTPAASYSIGFEAEGYDEMSYARIAARHFGTHHHEYYVTPDDIVRELPRIAAHYDQPFGNSSALPSYLCQMRARADGVTRMFAGDGGDELFGGNERYAKQSVFQWYGRIPQPLRQHLLEPALLGTALGRLPLVRKGASYITQARTPLPDRLQSYNLIERLQPAAVLTPEFLSRIDLEAPMKQQRAVWSQADGAGELDRMLAFDWRYTLAENDLPKVCGTASLAGMEVAFPLLDDDLLAFSMRLPTAYKLRGLKLRWFFKEALRGFLPDEIIAKPKHGFGLPFGVWLTRHPALRTFAEQALRQLATRGIVRPEFIEEVLNQRLAEHPGYYGNLVWILITLELWFRGRDEKSRSRRASV